MDDFVVRLVCLKDALDFLGTKIYFFMFLFMMDWIVRLFRKEDKI